MGFFDERAEPVLSRYLDKRAVRLRQFQQENRSTDVIACQEAGVTTASEVLGRKFLFDIFTRDVPLHSWGLRTNHGIMVVAALGLELKGKTLFDLMSHSAPYHGESMYAANTDLNQLGRQRESYSELRKRHGLGVDTYIASEDVGGQVFTSAMRDYMAEAELVMGALDNGPKPYRLVPVMAWLTREQGRFRDRKRRWSDALYFSPSLRSVKDKLLSYHPNLINENLVHDRVLNTGLGRLMITHFHPETRRFMWHMTKIPGATRKLYSNDQFHGAIQFAVTVRQVTFEQRLLNTESVRRIERHVLSSVDV